MHKKIILAAIIAVLCVGGLLCAGFLEENVYRVARMDFALSDEEILSQPYFDVFVPAKENRNLYSNVESYNIGDGLIHIVLPTEVSRKNVVVYFRNANGDFLARRVYDFTQNVSIGPWGIVIDSPVVPTLYFDSKNVNDYTAMIESPVTDLLCKGTLVICGGENQSDDDLSTGNSLQTPLKATLQGRGSSSWNCEYKKSYSLRLDKSINILGMGSYKNWNLIGNAYDPSLLKNTTFNNLANELGIRYQPQMKYVNLYIDGKYQGVYLITTKIAVSDSRVSLKKGDMFFRMDPPEAEQKLSYNSVTWFEDGNTSPAAELIYPENASKIQLERASEIIQRFVDCVENPEDENLEKYVDIDSLIKYYWIQEAGMNFDAWQRSVYLYYIENEDKIYFGPVWDMDLILGSPYEKADLTFDTPEGFRICTAGWYSTLFQRPEFVEEVVDYYMNKGVRQALLDTIDEFENQKSYLGKDAELNYMFYGHANMGTTINYGDTYEDYCNGMIDFYKARMDFIDNWITAMSN